MQTQLHAWWLRCWTAASDLATCGMEGLVMDATLRRLGDWLSSCCDGDWEHHKGVTITSLDNRAGG